MKRVGAWIRGGDARRRVRISRGVEQIRGLAFVPDLSLDPNRKKLVVAKFGGSSCGNHEAYGKLGDFFSSQIEDGHRMVGVFSAMFGVTDRLLSALYAAKGTMFLPTCVHYHMRVVLTIFLSSRRGRRAYRVQVSKTDL